MTRYASLGHLNSSCSVLDKATDALLSAKYWHLDKSKNTDLHAMGLAKAYNTDRVAQDSIQSVDMTNV